jgi:hypothetical protein
MQQITISKTFELKDADLTEIYGTRLYEELLLRKAIRFDSVSM